MTRRTVASSPTEIYMKDRTVQIDIICLDAVVAISRITYHMVVPLQATVLPPTVRYPRRKFYTLKLCVCMVEPTRCDLVNPLYTVTKNGGNFHQLKTHFFKIAFNLL
jgi:hypothetical protein